MAASAAEDSATNVLFFPFASVQIISFDWPKEISTSLSGSMPILILQRVGFMNTIDEEASLCWHLANREIYEHPLGPQEAQH